MEQIKKPLEKAKEEALILYKKKGFLSCNVLLDLSDELSLSEDEYDSLVSYLESKGIKLADEPLVSSNVTSSNDSVALYLSEMGKYPILSKEQEIELGKAMEVGKKAEVALLSDKSDEKELKNLVNDGKKAREKLITSNLRLVVSIASHYNRSDVPFCDLIQSGNEGLIRAVDKFDYTKGFKFSTYATWWIKQSINRGINDSKNSIHIPNHKAQDIARLKKNRAELAITLSREPTDEELIAAYPEWTSEKIKELDSYYKMPIVSLNEKVGDDENGELEDFEADIESEPDITKSLDLEDNMHQIANGLTALNSQERDIITRIYGISGKKKEDGESIAKDYHVSRERIRQIKERALRKMKEAIGNGK